MWKLKSHTQTAGIHCHLSPQPITKKKKKKSFLFRCQQGQTRLVEHKICIPYTLLDSQLYGWKHVHVLLRSVNSEQKSPTSQTDISGFTIFCRERKERKLSPLFLFIPLTVRSSVCRELSPTMARRHAYMAPQKTQVNEVSACGFSSVLFLPLFKPP